MSRLSQHRTDVAPAAEATSDARSTTTLAHAPEKAAPPPRGPHWPGLAELSTIPNLLSIVRLPLGLLLWVAPDNPWFLWWVGWAAAITDWVDGWAARHLPERWGGRRGDEAADAGGIGSWLDPLCDKAFVVMALIVVVVTYQPPWWAMAALLFRDIGQATALLAWRLLKGKAAVDAIDYHANRWGKATTVVQFLALAAVVFSLEAATPLALLAGGLGVIAVATLALRVLRTQAD
jgi:phosphatidylglycerophosphate synthase